MHAELEKCVVRSFREADAPSLARHANNRKIWINLRDQFPHPYAVQDAREFIELARCQDPETHFAIVVGGEAAGAIGFKLNTDVERVSVEVGYWLGEAYWGRGTVTEALRAMTRYAVDTYGVSRVYGVPFEWNAPSARVLEKAGYVFEGRLRRSAIKDGKIIDQLLYAFVLPE
jgi:ribosomal-protein-alanine N-acetyltransferase